MMVWFHLGLPARATSVKLEPSACMSVMGSHARRAHVSAVTEAKRVLDPMTTEEESSCGGFHSAVMIKSNRCVGGAVGGGY